LGEIAFRNGIALIRFVAAIFIESFFTSPADPRGNAAIFISPAFAIDRHWDRALAASTI